jgi:hypothetical protein
MQILAALTFRLPGTQLGATCATRKPHNITTARLFLFPQFLLAFSPRVPLR